MTSPVRKNRGDSVIIHFGATASELSQLFDLPVSRVTARLAGRVAPMTAAGQSAPRWNVKEAAVYLVNPKLDVGELLRTLNPSKLPPKLQAAFWAAQMDRVAFEQLQGELYNATRVREMLSSFCKPMRMTILMAKDEVASRTTLTPQQRVIIQEIMDSLLCQLRDGILKAFEGYEPPDDEHGRPIDEVANTAEAEQEQLPEKRGPGRPRNNPNPVGDNRFSEIDNSGLDDLDDEQEDFDDGFDDL